MAAEEADIRPFILVRYLPKRLSKLDEAMPCEPAQGRFKEEPVGAGGYAQQPIADGRVPHWNR